MKTMANIGAVGTDLGAPTTRPKDFSYLRFSNPEQAKGASRRRQVRAAARWTAERGLTLDEEL